MAKFFWNRSNLVTRAQFASAKFPAPPGILIREMRGGRTCRENSRALPESPEVDWVFAGYRKSLRHAISGDSGRAREFKQQVRPQRIPMIEILGKKGIFAEANCARVTNLDRSQKNSAIPNPGAHTKSCVEKYVPCRGF